MDGDNKINNEEKKPEFLKENPQEDSQEYFKNSEKPSLETENKNLSPFSEEPNSSPNEEKPFSESSFSSKNSQEGNLPPFSSKEPVSSGEEKPFAESFSPSSFENPQEESFSSSDNVSQGTLEPPPPPPPPEKPLSPKNNKKIFLILGAVLLLLVFGFLVFKFLLPRIKKPREVTLTYWGLWEPEIVMNGVIAEWEKEHPNIKVKYVQQSQREYRERLQSALARQEGPDIFRFHLTWVPMLKNDLDPVPTSVMSSSLYEQSFYPVVIKNLRGEASYLGIPLMVDNLALFYNEDIFLAGGKTPPKNWEELRQTARELTVKDEEGRIQTAGVALGTTNNVDHWSDILGLMMLQNQADLTNPAYCSKKGEEEICLGVDALKFYTAFYLVDKVWDETLPSSTQVFAAGKVAMYFGPSWRVFDIKSLNPRLNFKIIPVPQLPGGNVNWASFWVEGVSKKSPYKDEAWEFLKFLSSPTILEKLYQAESNLRLFGEIYPRIEMAEKLKTNPLVAPFLEQMPTAKTWYLCSFTWDNGINDRMIKYFEDAVNAVNQGEDPKEALTVTAQGVSQILSQYGVGSVFK